MIRFLINTTCGSPLFALLLASTLGVFILSLFG